MDARIKSGHDDSRAMRLARLILCEHAHDVGFLHDQELLTVELDLGARPLAEQHTVADPEVDRDQLAGFVAAARTDRRDLALGGLFLGAVWNDNAALGLFFGVDTFDHDAVMQRTKFGFSHDVSFGGSVFRSGLPSRADRSTGVFDTAWGKTAHILSNRALGVLIVRPGIWLDADPVKQGG